MKRTLIFILSILLLNSCFSINNEFTIHGTIHPKYDGQIARIHIARKDSLERIATDTIKDGHFNLKGRSYPDELTYLFVVGTDDPQKVKIVLTPILEAGTINISVNDTATTLSKIAGTYLNDEVNLYDDSIKILHEKYKNDDYTTRDYKLAEYRKRFFTKHNDDMAGYKIFVQKIAVNDTHLLDYYNVLSERVKQIPVIKSKADDYKKSERAMKQVGKKVTDFEFVDKEGNKKKISDYIGKSDFLFIDFWASWCGPCRKGIQDIKKSYQNCEQKGLKVLGISLDADMDSWRKALQEENMEWEQLVVQSSNDIKTIMDQYNMIGIPYTLLLDKNGNVLFVNLQGYSLESWLDNYSKIRK